MGYYFLSIGVVIALFAVWSLFNHLKLFILGVRTQGTIIDIDEQWRYGGSRAKKPYLHPVIEFETNRGETVTFTYGSVFLNGPPVVGDSVTVAYDPNTPDKATINSFMGVWAGPLAAAVLAAGTLYAGVELVFHAD